jgi:hypothetical protein
MAKWATDGLVDGVGGSSSHAFLIIVYGVQAMVEAQWFKVPLG